VQKCWAGPHSLKWKVPLVKIIVEKISSRLCHPGEGDAEGRGEWLTKPQIYNKITSCQSATLYECVCVCVRVSGIQKWHKKLFFQFLLFLRCFWQPFRSGRDSWRCLLHSPLNNSAMLVWVIILMHTSTQPLNVINHWNLPSYEALYGQPISQIMKCMQILQAVAGQLNYREIYLHLGWRDEEKGQSR